MPDDDEREEHGYLPSNGTEGEMFMAQTCYRCQHDHGYHNGRDDGPACEILGAALIHLNGEGPYEWGHDHYTGESWCSAFLPCDCGWESDSMRVTGIKPAPKFSLAAYAAWETRRRRERQNQETLFP